jgi:hypothetical protein
MANFLNNYDQNVITNSDYLKLLRLFTLQHYLPDGKIDLVEDYDPDKGGPIVYYYWSNHYNHSSFNNLVITGLCGIRPSQGDTLIINPLVDGSISYFCLDDVPYHGHKVTVVYDKEGRKYKLGKGLTVFVDGKKAALQQKQGKYEVIIGAPIGRPAAAESTDFALNINRQGYPVPSASINSAPDSSLYQAIDGRIWYFKDITNRWTTLASTSNTDWFALDFGQLHEVSGIKLYLCADGELFHIPDNFTIEYQSGGLWLPVKEKERSPAQPVANTVNKVIFDKVAASGIRINFKHTSTEIAVTEVECY